jgi:hypothetical protein
MLLCGAMASCGTFSPDPQVIVIPTDVGDVAAQGWTHYALPGKKATRYSTVLLDGRSVIRADAQASVSMLRRTLRIEPDQLGHVRFSWLVPQLIKSARLSDRDAADSPARIVLAFEGDRRKLSMKTRMMFELAETLTGEAPPYATLMYVWDNHAPLESVIHSGRTDRVRKIVVDSGPRHVKTWRQHERAIAEDFRRAFGEEPGALVGVALMTDSDNTGSRAQAFYGELRLVYLGED